MCPFLLIRLREWTAGSPVSGWEERVEGVPADGEDDTEKVGDERDPPEHLLPRLDVDVLQHGDTYQQTWGGRNTSVRSNL